MGNRTLNSRFGLLKGGVIYGYLVQCMTKVMSYPTEVILNLCSSPVFSVTICQLQFNLRKVFEALNSLINTFTQIYRLCQLKLEDWISQRRYPFFYWQNFQTCCFWKKIKMSNFNMKILIEEAFRNRDINFAAHYTDLLNIVDRYFLDKILYLFHISSH